MSELKSDMGVDDNVRKVVSAATVNDKHCLKTLPLELAQMESESDTVIPVPHPTPPTIPSPCQIRAGGGGGGDSYKQRKVVHQTKRQREEHAGNQQTTVRDAVTPGLSSCGTDNTVHFPRLHLATA